MIVYYSFYQISLLFPLHWLITLSCCSTTILVISILRIKVTSYLNYLLELAGSEFRTLDSQLLCSCNSATTRWLTLFDIQLVFFLWSEINSWEHLQKHRSVMYISQHLHSVVVSRPSKKFTGLGLNHGLGRWHTAHPAVHPPFLGSLMTGYLGKLGKVNCGNSDVPLALCPGATSFHPQQAQGLLGWRWAMKLHATSVYAPNITLSIWL